MNLPVSLGDRLGLQETIVASFRSELRKSLSQPVAIDPTIDDDMGDVQPGRPELPCHALRNGTQARFRRSKGRKFGSAAQTA